MSTENFKMIHIHGDITDTLVSEITPSFNVVSKNDIVPIFFDIDSTGGDPRLVSKMLDLKKTYPSKTIGYVSSKAESAAFVFLELCCDIRIIQKDASLLHHDLTRLLKIDITPTTDLLKVNEFINRHLNEVVEKQKAFDDEISKKVILPVEKIYELKKTGKIYSSDSLSFNLVDKIVSTKSEAVEYANEILSCYLK